MNEKNEKAFETAYDNYLAGQDVESTLLDCAEFMFKAGMEARDAQPAQGQQEPVAWWNGKANFALNWEKQDTSRENCTKDCVIPLYTHPAPDQPAQGQHEAVELQPIEQDALYALARQCLWVAHCWNDHNFPLQAHEYCRNEAQRLDLMDFDKANAWLKKQTTPPAAPDVRELVEELKRIVETLPAHSDDNGFFIEHYDIYGEYSGTQYVDPVWVAREMEAIAQAALAKHGGA